MYKFIAIAQSAEWPNTSSRIY